MSDTLDVSDEEIAQAGEDAIAHFGMKGMRWGIRNKRDDGGDGSSSGEIPLYYDVRQKREIGKTTAKVAGGAVVAATVLAIGAAAATVILSKQGGSNYAQALQAGYKPPKVNIPAAKIARATGKTAVGGAKLVVRGAKAATEILGTTGDLPMSSTLGGVRL
jgi:hypothetical protein